MLHKMERASSIAFVFCGAILCLAGGMKLRSVVSPASDGSLITGWPGSDALGVAAVVEMVSGGLLVTFPRMA